MPSYVSDRKTGDLTLVVDNGKDADRPPALKAERSVDPFVQALGAIAERQDRDAFRLLFEHFAPRVKSYLVRQGTSQGQSEELMQEVMLKVWQKAALFDPAKAAPSTWIFRIARNQRIDAFRKDSRPNFDPDDPGLQPAPEPEADLVVEQLEDAARVREALQSLPKEQKDVLELSFYQDMSHGAISEHLGVPLGTVKSRMRLAFRKLAGQMEEV